MPSKGFRVKKDVDKGFDAFFKGIAQIGSTRAKVGIQGKEASRQLGNGLTMVALGTIHEFGAPRANIPQRSFLRSTADANRKKYERDLSDSIRKLVLRPRAFSAEGEVFKLGEQVRADVINKIRSKIPPPNKPATIARKKGEDVPLVDTGQLVASIRSVVSKTRTILKSISGNIDV